MTPDVSEPTKPRGCPTAYVSSPIWPTPPSTAGTIGLGGRSGTSTAMSLSGSVETIWPFDRVPSTKNEPDRRRAVDHVERGEDRSARVDDDSSAEPGGVPARRRGCSPRSGRATAGSAGRRRRRSPAPSAGPRSPSRRRPTRSIPRRHARARAPTGRAWRGRRRPRARPRSRESPRSRSVRADSDGRAGRAAGRVRAGVASPGSALAGTLAMLESRVGADRARFGRLISPQCPHSRVPDDVDAAIDARER